jgi:hypothetical protein
MKSTSSPVLSSSANGAATAAFLTTRTAPGTYGIRDPGRTMPARGPMSRVALAISYRASHVVPGAWAVMRGATAPTAGSAKCGSNGPSHPGRGTQSESTNAISGVSATARPAFRAAPAPPFTGRRTTRAPAAAATAAIAPGSREPSSTTTTRNR